MRKLSGFLLAVKSGLFQIGVYLDDARRELCDLIKFPPGCQSCCYCLHFKTIMLFDCLIVEG